MQNAHQLISLLQPLSHTILVSCINAASAHLFPSNRRTAVEQPCSFVAASPSAWPAARVFPPHSSAYLSVPSAACTSTLAAHSPPVRCFDLLQLDLPVLRLNFLCCRVQVGRRSGRISQQETVRDVRAYPDSFRHVSAGCRLQGGSLRAMRLAQSGGRFPR